MASFKDSMRTHVAGSMNDRVAAGAAPVNNDAAGQGRSALERQSDGRKRLDTAAVIRLDRIAPDPDQPRKEFDPEALEQLAVSMKTRGQLQPIRVRWNDSLDRYVVVVGERRFRAAKIAGMETIAAVVVTGEANPEDLLEDQLVENALRENLKPIEQAKAYEALLTARGLTQRQLADRLQIGHASIARALALLNLPEPIQEKVEAGDIAANTAYELSKVEDPAEQAELAVEASAGRLKRDQIAERTRSAKKTRTAKKTRASAVETTAMLEELKLPIVRTFNTTFGAKVMVESYGGLNLDTVITALEEVLSLLTLGREPRLKDVG